MQQARQWSREILRCIPDGRRRGVLILLVVCPQCLFAHDFWIELSDFNPATNELVRVHLKVGEKLAGQPVIRDQGSIEQFIYGGKPIIGRDGKDPAGLFRASDQGVVGFRSKPQRIELAAVKFEEYLFQEGLEKIIAERHQRGDAQKPGRELFSRCAKALLASAPDAGRSLDFRLELVPEHAPAQGVNTVRLLYEGAALPGALVVAVSKAHPESRQRVRSDTTGRAAFTLSDPGLWLIKAVHMIPARSAEADWESLWASITFELR